MPRRTKYYFRETVSGLVRNPLVAFAAISTTFIALLLVGLALLAQREVDLIAEGVGETVVVKVFLLDTITPDQQEALADKLAAMPEVADVRYESKDEACQRYMEMFRNDPDMLRNLDCNALPASFQVTMNDPERYKVVGERLQGQPGIEEIKDNQEVLDKVFAITSVFRIGMLMVGILMLVSALILIANTVRVGLYARRKEIGIMKLVGATNWHVRTPFLIEGVVEGLLGAVLAVGVLFLLKYLFINPLYGKILAFPWVQTSDVIVVVPWLVGCGVIVAVVASFIGMRRFLDI